jgi:hypothetical protein
VIVVDKPSMVATPELRRLLEASTAAAPADSSRE